MNKLPLSVCPVPSDQQPVNEYEQLRESFLFRWVTLEPFAYTRKLFWVWLWGWAVSGPIAAASFAPARYPFEFALCGGGGAMILVVLLLVRFYLGWSYVRDRLSQDTIFYEESGWYDGQTWQKPPEMVTRDRLIVSYQVQPILHRLLRSLGAIALLLALGSITWVAL